MKTNTFKVMTYRILAASVLALVSVKASEISVMGASGNHASAEAFLEKSNVFTPGFNGVAHYRIPGIVVTPAGTVLAYSEARINERRDWGEIEVHLRRSTDGGRSWEPSQHIAHLGERIEGNPHKRDVEGAREQTVNNPVAIVDQQTGAIVFLYCVNYARAFSIQSTDDGLTWSEPVEITDAFEPFRKHYDWDVIATGPGHGLQMKSGRLVVPVWIAYGQSRSHRPSAVATIYSDDHGLTWQGGDIAVPNEGLFNNPNEAMIAELSDGSVMLVARNESGSNRKIVTISSDGATGWSQPKFHPQLWEPVCMASIIAHPSQPGSLLFSNPHTLALDEDGKEIPAGRGPRRNLSIKLSRDDGKTWAISKTLVESGRSAYSDLAVLPDGTVLCIYEDTGISIARFNLEWVESP
jgi:sialidase-1